MASVSRALMTVALLVCAFSTAVIGDDRFAIAVGQHGELIVFGPKGEKVGSFPIPSIAQPVIIDGTTSFQISYGRDVNNMLTAILSPNAAQPSALHFNVLNKAVDTDKQAVVTLTFSSSLNHVAVDPGYIGVVQVDAEKVGHRATHDSTYVPASSHKKSHAESEAASTSPAPEDIKPRASASPAPRLNDADIAPRDLPPRTPPASHPAPSTVSVSAVGAATDSTTATDTNDAATGKSGKTTISKTYWPEPVTSPDGSTPQVGPNEMKLVAVHGSVTVKTPDGSTEDGSNGMVIPSGSSVSTADNSSAAVFMGGVASARLMPNAQMTVAQHMDGNVRHATVDLQKGAVFSRIGKRPGETEKYEVRTPEGVAAARGCQYGVVYVPPAAAGDAGTIYVFGKEGIIDVLNHLGKLMRTIEATGGTHIEIFVMSHDKSLGSAAGKHVLTITLEGAQPFNVDTYKAIQDTISGHPSDADKKILQEESVFLTFSDSDGGTTGFGDGTFGGGDHNGDNTTTTGGSPGGTGGLNDTAVPSSLLLANNLAGLIPPQAMEGQPDTH